MISIKIQPDKLDLLLTEEAKLRQQLVDVRYKINSIKCYRKKKNLPLNTSLLNQMIEKYNLQIGQKFNNEITGEGEIIEIGCKNNDLGFYYLNKNCIKKSFAELGGIKFKTITQTRIN